ncbi:MAG TPA: sigma factor-like helix-turn-helix DNA-binding protein, partial [Gemmatimonadaceae bacterium]|nr:sigma factor-like helix-turn-helix DNA-binding protein [Gemmatimonadaceae bacterium]
PREALVLELYFGIGRTEPMTLDEVGRALGITRERVRQIKEKALRKLRRDEGSAGLVHWRALYDESTLSAGASGSGPTR